MSNRFKTAQIIQSGASNQRLIAAKLLEAIDEVRNENGDIQSDPAVFLILHQLAWVLTGHDFSIGNRMGERWSEATKAIEAKLAEVPQS